MLRNSEIPNLPSVVRILNLEALRLRKYGESLPKGTKRNFVLEAADKASAAAMRLYLATERT